MVLDLSIEYQVLQVLAFITDFPYSTFSYTDLPLNSNVLLRFSFISKS